eukprot:3870195-Alexandrium_andersonii.AAC.1
MSASLVGSEMCIRDSPSATWQFPRRPLRRLQVPPAHAVRAVAEARLPRGVGPDARPLAPQGA